MEPPITHWIGIDVAKATLDILILPEHTRLQVANTTAGWARLIHRLGTMPCRIVLEPTGGYHRGLVEALDAAGQPAAIVNPRWIRAFAASVGQRAKTDRLDALVLALYAQRMDPPVRPLPSPAVRQLQAAIARRADLVKLRTMEQNRAHLLDPLLQPSVALSLAHLREQIQQLDRLIADLVAADAGLRAQVAQLRSVPGIGPVIAPLLASRLPELGTATRQQLAALAGVAPYAQESGQFRGHRHIQGGRQDVTVALYQALTTACRRNPVLAARYRHLREDRHKPHKVAIIACARWLLGVIVAMTRDGLTWDQTRAAQPASHGAS